MERTQFEEELRRLQAGLNELADLAAGRLDAALLALFERRVDLARQVIAGDALLTDLQKALDARAMRVFALQQPAARDLRLVLAVMKAAGDLERIADHAVNIAQTVVVIHASPSVPTEAALHRMGQMSIDMLREAVSAFQAGDVGLARSVLAGDHDVDEARRDVFRQLLEHIHRSPPDTEACVNLMLVSRNLERVADLATNIAEDAIFLVSARDVRHMADLQAAVNGVVATGPPGAAPQ
jgi:phosphate transport system protein